MNWENDGQEIRNFVDEKGKLRSRPQNTDFYFREAITWSDITSGDFSMRFRDTGSIFDSTGHSAFSDNRDDLYYLLGLLNTPVANYIFRILNPTIHMHIGYVSLFPVFVEKTIKEMVINSTKRAIEIARIDWMDKENSWADFNQHPLLQKGLTLSAAQENRNKLISNNRNELSKIETELNNYFITYYGLEPELKEQGISRNPTIQDIDIQRDIKSLISYAVGCMFGRYSLDINGLAFAGGEWGTSNYQSFQPDKDNILLISEDKYFEDSSIDVVGRFIEFVRVTLGEDNLEQNLQFIADALGRKGTSREVIRNYFVKDFFKDHVQTYKKRPIYWQFESGRNGGFKALIYVHRYTSDTLGTMRIDYLHQLQKAYENTIEQLQAQIQQSSSSADKNTYTKQLQKVLKQYEETKAYDSKLGHLANMKIELNLDDGVIFNYEKLQTDENGKNLKVLSSR